MIIALLTLLSPLLFAAPVKAPPAWLPKVPRPLSEPLPNDPLKVTIRRLPNGLTVYMSPSHEIPRVAAWVAVRTGSYNDPATNTGLAHYLEHMLFKGSEKLGTLDYAAEKPHLERIVALYQKRFHSTDPAERARLYKEIDAESIAASRYEIPNEIDKVYHALGFRGLNAFTSDEQTVYVVDMPANRLDVWARLESDRFAHPIFRLFQSELEAVYEEKNRSLDNADRQLGEAVNKLLYGEVPYGRDTLGHIKHLKNPSLQSMYDFYRRYYVPDNMALVLAGDFDPDKVMPLLERRFGAWKPKPVPPEKAWPWRKPKGRVFKEIKFDAEEKVVIAWPTVPYLDADADALSVMDMLMDNEVAGIINLTLDQAQKVKAAGSNPDFYNRAGDWQVWAVPKRGQTLEQAEALLMGAVAKLKSGQFTDQDIAAVVTNFEVDEKQRLESDDARTAAMTDSYIHYEPWSRQVDRLDRLRKITKADVLRVADKYLGGDRVVVYRRRGQPVLPSITKPNFTEVRIEPTRISTFAASLLAMPAKPIEPRWLVEGRDYWKRRTPAGELIGAANPYNDLFQLTFRFDRGQRQERDLCMALDLLDHAGAGPLSADDFRKKLYGLGTTLSVGCGQQESDVTLAGLDRNLWPSLQLLRAHFDAPTVSSDALPKLVVVELGAHQDNKRDPGAVFGALSDWAHRGQDSPTLHEFSDRELRDLKAPALEKTIERAFDYRRRVGYVGNRPAGELAKLLSEDKRYRKPRPRKAVRLIRPGHPIAYFTNRDMVQARVGVFAADETLDPAHAVDYSFYSAYEGGGMSSVIFQEVREARSLAYAAWGGYVPGAHKGDDNEALGELGCEADKTPEAAGLLRALIEKPPFSQDRFEESRRALIENYRDNPIRFREIPAALMAWEDQGISGGDPRPARFEQTQGYRLSDLETFSRRFEKEPMTLYILGDRSRVGLDALKKLGDFREKPLDSLFPY